MTSSHINVIMVNHSIKVYARVKTLTAVERRLYQIVQKKPNFEDIVIYNSSTPCKFRFHKIFDQASNQEDIFDIVAKPVINSVLQGFNGTIFAYGQTGSGKTYTITGSPKNYNDRGIIPRSIQYIFAQNDKISVKPTIYISYMEIYNEVGYDLVSSRQNNAARSLEELPRIILLEDGKGEAHIRNLSVLPVTTEQEAMRLLFLGDTNRTIAETPMNEYSSRSHCIFTIYITFRNETSNVIRFSKLHLVDLAGSERVCKSQTTGTALNEAKFINLSLHFLQQVIVALSESKRSHIPYRNSMMTYILKDSLSGNCLTVMFATLAVTKNNIQETISTCRFAQRVSLISTEPVINELSDPQREIAFLRNKIEELEKQIASFTGITASSTLTKDQEEDCKNEVEQYLNALEFNDDLIVKSDLKQIQFCFKLFKLKINSQNNANEEQKVEFNKILKNIAILEDVIHKKDAEITTLRNIIDQIPERPINPNTLLPNRNDSKPLLESNPINILESSTSNCTPNAVTAYLKKNQNIHTIDIPALSEGIGDTTIHENEKDLFQQFIANPSNSKDLRYYTGNLEKKLEMARIYADAIDQCQQNIIYIRQKLQACSHETIKSQLLCELEEQQDIYSKSLVDLKAIKSETYHLQSGLKQAQIKIKQRFEIWLSDYQASKATNHFKDQWKNSTDQFSCNDISQYTPTQNCYIDPSCEIEMDQTLSDQFSYNNRCQHNNQNDNQNYFNPDFPCAIKPDKKCDSLDYNNHSEYNDQKDYRKYFRQDPSYAIKMDTNLPDPFDCCQYGNRNDTRCCFKQSSACDIQKDKIYSSNCYNADGPLCTDCSKTSLCLSSQNKSYSDCQHTCISEEHCEPQNINACNQQPHINRNSFNNGNQGSHQSANNERLYNTSESLHSHGLQQKLATSYQNQKHSCQNVRLDCRFNNDNRCTANIVLTGAIENNERNRCYRRNGLEEVRKGAYIQYERNVNNSTKRNEICTCHENSAEGIFINKSDTFIPTGHLLNLPCEVEVVREDSNSQGNYYHQDHMKASNHIEEAIQMSTRKVRNNSYLLKASDSIEFVEFMKTVSLTGEAEIDEEICNFYRSKFPS